MLRSNAEFSTKRFNQLLEEIFGDEEHVETAKFLTKFRLLERDALEDIKSGKVAPDVGKEQMQFRIDLDGEVDAFDDRADIEPDVTKYGAFFLS